MDKTSKILILLIFLALMANLFRPLFFPGPACADEPYYQVAILRSQLKIGLIEFDEKIQKLGRNFDGHTHKMRICKCDQDAPRMEVEISKPEYPYNDS